MVLKADMDPLVDVTCKKEKMVIIHVPMSKFSFLTVVCQMNHLDFDIMKIGQMIVSFGMLLGYP